MNNFQNKKEKILFITTLVGIFLMIISLFLPYSTAIGNHRKSIADNPDRVVYDELNMTADDIMNISMVKYAWIYSNMSEELWGNSGNGIFYVVLVILMLGFSLLSLMFTIKKKTVKVIVFNVLAFVVFSIENSDFSMRHVVPGDYYAHGIAYYTFYVAAIIVLCSAIFTILTKNRSKQ